VYWHSTAKKLYLAKISHYRDNSAGCTYQQSSMSLYISFEQPGGGGSLCPSLTRDITWNGSDSQDWHEYGDLSWSLKSQTSNVCIYACYWIPQDCLWIQTVLSPMTRLHREPHHSSTHHWQQWTCGSWGPTIANSKQNSHTYPTSLFPRPSATKLKEGGKLFMKSLEWGQSYLSS